MSGKPFDVRADAEGVLWLSGELDLEQADALPEAVAEHLGGRESVVLDCSRLTFLDSSGLRAILSVASTVPVVLRSPPRNVLTVLDIAGVDEALGVRIEPPL